MITSHTIEMSRSVERTLPGGERTTFSAGQRYTVDDATAQELTASTIGTRTVDDAVEEYPVPAAAAIVETFLIPETDEERDALAATERTDIAPAPQHDDADDEGVE